MEPLIFSVRQIRLFLVPKWHLACGGQIGVYRNSVTVSGSRAKCSNILQDNRECGRSSTLILADMSQSVKAFKM